MNDDATEEEQRKEVGNGHECIHAVGKIPYDAEIHDGTHEDCNDIEHSVINCPATAFEIFYGSFTIKLPSENGGESEGEKTEGEQRSTDIWNLGESHLGKCGSVLVTDVGIGNDGTDNNQSCEGADNHRIPERTTGRDECLTYRIAGLCCRSHDGCTTHT